MTDDEVRTHWAGFIEMCEKIADPEIWRELVLGKNTDLRLQLTERFVDVMRGFGHEVTDEQVHVATGYWSR